MLGYRGGGEKSPVGGKSGDPRNTDRANLKTLTQVRNRRVACAVEQVRVCNESRRCSERSCGTGVCTIIFTE